MEVAGEGAGEGAGERAGEVAGEVAGEEAGEGAGDWDGETWMGIVCGRMRLTVGWGGVGWGVVGGCCGVWWGGVVGCGGGCKPNANTNEWCSLEVPRTWWSVRTWSYAEGRTCPSVRSSFSRNASPTDSKLSYTWRSTWKSRRVCPSRRCWCQFH